MNLNFLKTKKQKLKTNSGFSVIIAMLMTAFLVIVTSGILTIVLQEAKNTRLVYNSITTFASSEGAIEFALLKIKNHSEGFQDSITENDPDYKIYNNFADIGGKNSTLEYEINNFATIYSGEISYGDFDMIPLYFDSGSYISTNSKEPNGSSNIKQTADFKLNFGGEIIWNIIGEDTNGDSFGIYGTGSNGTFINSETNEGLIRRIEESSIAGAKKLTLSSTGISDFLSNYKNNYLILFNPNKNSKTSYNLESSNGFTLPKMSIVGSSRIGSFKQNLLFEQSKSKYFEMLKYSIITGVGE